MQSNEDGEKKIQKKHLKSGEKTKGNPVKVSTHCHVLTTESNKIRERQLSCLWCVCFVSIPSIYERTLCILYMKRDPSENTFS